VLFTSLNSVPSGKLYRLNVGLYALLQFLVNNIPNVATINKNSLFIATILCIVFASNIDSNHNSKTRNTPNMI
tara:strand:+ start:39 stop:257 length:219 start_codon:yes stop_codon:yes gene_type:complete